MKNPRYLFAIVLPLPLLLLAACNESGSDAEPQAVTTAFGQDFTLRYRQSARLPTAANPELVVRVDDLQFTICPKNVNCLVPDFAAPTLAITGLDGQTQLLKMPTGNKLTVSRQYPDSASFRANGRRYVMYYTEWKLNPAKQDNPTRQDFTLSLRVEKPE